MKRRRKPNSPKRRARFKRWFILLDGDGDVVSGSESRRALETVKSSMERNRPCGPYTIEEQKWRDRENR